MRTTLETRSLASNPIPHRHLGDDNIYRDLLHKWPGPSVTLVKEGKTSLSSLPTTWGGGKDQMRLITWDKAFLDCIVLSRPKKLSLQYGKHSKQPLDYLATFFIPLLQKHPYFVLKVFSSPAVLVRWWRLITFTTEANRVPERSLAKSFCWWPSDLRLANQIPLWKVNLEHNKSQKTTGAYSRRGLFLLGCHFWSSCFWLRSLEKVSDSSVFPNLAGSDSLSSQSP